MERPDINTVFIESSHRHLELLESYREVRIVFKTIVIEDNMREGLKLNLQCFHEDVFSDGSCQQICMLQKESNLGATCQLHKGLLGCNEQFF